MQPFLALTESFYNLADRLRSKELYKLPYQVLSIPDFVVDSRTYKERLFIIRLDLRTLAAHILGYKLVPLVVCVAASSCFHLHRICRQVPLIITMDFSQKTPAEGISCMVLAEHEVACKVKPNGQVTTHVLAK